MSILRFNAGPQRRLCYDHATELLHRGKNVVVLGDFNDGPETATTQILFGPPGSQPCGPEDATRASGAFQRRDQKDPQRLFNVTNLTPHEVRWSRKHNGQPELLDQILASEGLMPIKDGLRQIPEIRILNDDTLGIAGEHPRDMKVVPDHAPVTATFRV